MPNSSAITCLNNYKTNIPRISIVGEEQGPEIWKVASTAYTQTSGNSGNDTKIHYVADNMRSYLNTLVIIHTTAAVTSGVLGFINPLAWFATADQSYQAVQAQRGVDWLSNAQSTWNGLIKTKVRQTRTHTYSITKNYFNDCGSRYSFGSNYWVECFKKCPKRPRSKCFSDETKTYTGTYIYTETFRNDGLLSTYHQTIPGLTSEDIYTARGVNHIEMMDARGSTYKPGGRDEMEIVYDNVFGNRKSGDHFKLTKK